MINTALAINPNWRLAEPGIRRFKKQYPNARSRPDLKDKSPIRKPVVFALVVGLALCQAVVVIHPVYAPATSINIQNFAFNPQNATIQTGDFVTWINKDPVIYTLWFRNVGDGSTYLLSQPISPGTTWTHAFPDSIMLSYSDFDRLYVTGQLIVVLSPGPTVGGGGGGGRVLPK